MLDSARRISDHSLESLGVPAYSLSRTFRFNDGLARHISRQVQEAYALIGEPRTLKMRGTATETRWGSRVVTPYRAFQQCAVL